MYKDLIGKPFSYHGRGPDSYDCLGLAIEVLRRNGITLTDQSTYEANAKSISVILESSKREVLKLTKPELLAIVTIQVVPRFVSHIGIIIDRFGNFIHTLENTQVTIENINSLLWKNKIEGYYKWTT